MTGLDERRRRIVRIHGVEQRIAQTELLQAQRGAMQIQSIVDRIGALALENRVGEGETDGLALAALADTRARLQSAHRSTLQPLEKALDTVSLRKCGNIRAQMKEKGARRLLEIAVRDSDILAERRRSAAHVWTASKDEDQ